MKQRKEYLKAILERVTLTKLLVADNNLIKINTFKGSFLDPWIVCCPANTI